MRVQVTMACGECKNRNYRMSKNKKKTERLTLAKYCSVCRKHTEHKEVK